MALLQPGDKYQIIWNGYEHVLVWTDGVALSDGDTIHIGIDPESTSTPSVLLPIMNNNMKRITHTNLRR